MASAARRMRGGVALPQLGHEPEKFVSRLCHPVESCGAGTMASLKAIRTVVNTKDVNNYSLARQGKHSHRLSLVERKHLLVSPECRRGYRLLRPALSYWKQPNVYRWAETKLRHNPSNR